MKLWEGLEQDLNFNTMVSQRGVLNLYHSDGQRDAYARRGNAMRLHGVDAELLDRDEVRELLPFLDFDNARFPIHGGLMQRRGGTARHDAVVWGYARAAPTQRGVDIIQNCEVTGIRSRHGPRRSAWKRPAASIGASKVALAVAGNSSRLAAMAGLAPADRKPRAAGLRHRRHQAADRSRHHLRRRPFLHQPIRQGRPGLRRRHRRLQFLCPARQSADRRGRLRRRHGDDARARRGCASLRSWGGMMDMSMDGSPIIDRTPIDGLYLNAGWCYGGFKATPASGWCFAHLLARDEPHPAAAAYRLDRFASGHVIDEKGAGAAAQSALRMTPCASPAPIAATATSREFVLIAVMPRARAASTAIAGGAIGRLRLSARQSGRAARASIWYHAAGCRRLAGGRARHPHARAFVRGASAGAQGRKHRARLETACCDRRSRIV